MATGFAVNRLIVQDLHALLQLLLEMNTQTMNDAIALCHGLERASVEWAGKGRFLLLYELRVFRAHVEVERLFLEEPLFARLAHVATLLEVLLHVVMHGVLAGLDDIAFRAYKMTILVLDVGKGHFITKRRLGAEFRIGRHFQFYFADISTRRTFRYACASCSV